MRIIVIGGGVAGCAAAYYLARAGVAVTLVERETPACSASGYAVGLLNPLTGDGVPGPMEPLSALAFQMHRQLWPELEEQSGIDIQAETVPHLELCHTEEDAIRAAQTMTRWKHAPGFSSEWLQPNQVREIEPRVNEDVLGAILLENVALLDSRRLTLALLRAAQARGVAVVRDEVTGITPSGVMIGGRESKCDAAVIAMGPWSGRASQWLGLDVPVEPLKGQILHLQALDPPLACHLAGPGQVAHKKDRLVWLAATEEDAGFDTRTTPQARDLLMDRAIRMVPSLANRPVVAQTACLRPISPDRLPIIGPLPGRERIYLATAAGKKGILIGPAMGRAIADLITQGKTDLPIGPFSLTRFLRS